jgi:hypothetical protein
MLTHRVLVVVLLLLLLLALQSAAACPEPACAKAERTRCCGTGPCSEDGAACLRAVVAPECLPATEDLLLCEQWPDVPLLSEPYAARPPPGTCCTATTTTTTPTEACSAWNASLWNASLWNTSLPLRATGADVARATQLPPEVRLAVLQTPPACHLLGSQRTLPDFDALGVGVRFASLADRFAPPPVVACTQSCPPGRFVPACAGLGTAVFGYSEPLACSGECAAAPDHRLVLGCAQAACPRAGIACAADNNSSSEAARYGERCLTETEWACAACPPPPVGARYTTAPTAYGRASCLAAVECPPGQRLRNGACTGECLNDCARGEFCDTQQCVQCPPPSSPEAVWPAVGCEWACAPGFFKQNGTCAECPWRFFCTGEGPPVMCPVGSLSHPGAPNISACVALRNTLPQAYNGSTLLWSSAECAAFEFAAEAVVAVLGSFAAANQSVQQRLARAAGLCNGLFRPAVQKRFLRQLPCTCRSHPVVTATLLNESTRLLAVGADRATSKQLSCPGGLYLVSGGKPAPGERVPENRCVRCRSREELSCSPASYSPLCRAGAHYLDPAFYAADAAGTLRLRAAARPDACAWPCPPLGPFEYYTNEGHAGDCRRALCTGDCGAEAFAPAFGFTKAFFALGCRDRELACEACPPAPPGALFVHAVTRGAAECAWACRPGFSLLPDGSGCAACGPCAPGTRAAACAPLACEACPPPLTEGLGSAWAWTNGSCAWACRTGYYTGANGTCVACPLGHACPEGSAQPCAPGTWTAAPAQPRCHACPVGSYCPAGAALPCPLGTSTRAAGAASLLDCTPDAPADAPEPEPPCPSGAAQRWTLSASPAWPAGEALARVAPGVLLLARGPALVRVFAVDGSEQHVAGAAGGTACSADEQPLRLTRLFGAAAALAASANFVWAADRAGGVFALRFTRSALAQQAGFDDTGTCTQLRAVALAGIHSQPPLLVAVAPRAVWRFAANGATQRTPLLHTAYASALTPAMLLLLLLAADGRAWLACLTADNNTTAYAPLPLLEADGLGAADALGALLLAASSSGRFLLVSGARVFELAVSAADCSAAVTLLHAAPEPQPQLLAAAADAGALWVLRSAGAPQRLALACVSCPPLHTLQAGACVFGACPADAWCPPGSEQPERCPPGTVSPAGTAEREACRCADGSQAAPVEATEAPELLRIAPPVLAVWDGLFRAPGAPRCDVFFRAGGCRRPGVTVLSATDSVALVGDRLFWPATPSAPTQLAFALAARERPRAEPLLYALRDATVGSELLELPLAPGAAASRVFASAEPLAALAATRTRWVFLLHQRRAQLSVFDADAWALHTPLVWLDGAPAVRLSCFLLLAACLPV